MQMPATRYLLRLGQGFCVGRVGSTAACRSKNLAAGQPQNIQLVVSLNIHARWQHQDSNNGPHKEYFQVPGREPKPDLTPYVRSSQPSPQTQPLSQFPQASRPNQPVPVSDSPPTPKGWQRIPRFIRSSIWTLVFLQLGVAAGTALITWEYLAPPFEPGSPEDQELVEEILDTLDTHPMVEDLRENGWTEVDAYTPDLQHGMRGKNLVHQVLGRNNTQGVFMRVFHHPTQEYTMLVFFFGFGVEGWPDVIHGGLTSTLLQEAVGKHIEHYYPAFYAAPDSKSKIDFKKPCKPGDVYGILVMPSGRKAVVSGNVHLTEVQVTGLLVQLNGAPSVVSDFDLQSHVERHTVRMPTQRGQEPSHVVCQTEVKIIPKQLGQDGKAYEVGSNENGGFDRALDFLKNAPEFRSTQPPPTSEQHDEEKKDG